MTDRALLEAAARAAGHKTRPDWYAHDRGVCLVNERGNQSVGWFNPLADDADALRLAVKLGLSPEVHYDVSQPKPWLRVTYRQRNGDENWTHVDPETYVKDPYAATRRAIVRAAAAMAKEER